MKFTKYAEKYDHVKFDKNAFNHCKKVMAETLKAEIARQLWEEQGYFEVMNGYDNEVQRALKVLMK